MQVVFILFILAIIMRICIDLDKDDFMMFLKKIKLMELKLLKNQEKDYECGIIYEKALININLMFIYLMMIDFGYVQPDGASNLVNGSQIRIKNIYSRLCPRFNYSTVTNGLDENLK